MPRRATIRASRSSERTRSPLSELETAKLRLFGVAVICAKVALVPVVFDHAADFPFTVPKALLSHGLAYVLVGVIVGLLIQYRRAVLKWSSIHLPVLAFLGVSTLATLLAADRTIALFGTHARMLGLGTIADGVVLYVSIVLLARRRSEILAIAGCAVGAGVVVLGYEAVQLTGKDPFVWDTSGALNPFSTLGQPTTLGLYLAVIAVGSFALGAHIPNLNRLQRAVLFLYSGVAVAGAAATGTRSVLLGLAAGAAVVVLAIWSRQPSRLTRRVLAIGAIGAAVAMVVLVAVTPIGPRIVATLQNLAGQTTEAAQLDRSTLTRVVLYQIAADEVRERPLLGYGPDNFMVGVPRYRPEPSPVGLRQSLATSAHSWIAEIATSSGILGLGCFLAILILAFVHAVRDLASPLVAVGAALLAAYLGAGVTTVSDVATAPLLWLSLAMIATARVGTTSDPPPSSRQIRQRNQSRDRGLPIRDVVAFTTTALGVALLVSTVTALGASRSSGLSQAARVPGQVPHAIELALDATRADPGRPDYWDGLGLAYVAASRWPDAVAAFDRASRLAPYDISYKNDEIAAVLSLGGNEARTRAVELAEQIVSIDANNPLAQLTRANVMQVSGNLPEAVRSVERALALDPDSTNERLYVTATQAYLDSGRADNAVQIARHGLAIIDAREVSVKSVPLRYELVRALATNGQRQDALAELDLLLRIRPGYGPAQQLRLQLGG